MLHDRFTDKDIELSYHKCGPVMNSCQSIIDEQHGHGHGIFNDCCTFNPNNLTCIELPWSEDDVHKFLDKVLTEYKALMALYTKGTGGGPGVSEYYADCWLCLAECVVEYIPAM